VAEINNEIPQDNSCFGRYSNCVHSWIQFGRFTTRARQFGRFIYLFIYLFICLVNNIIYFRSATKSIWWLHFYPLCAPTWFAFVNVAVGLLYLQPDCTHTCAVRLTAWSVSGMLVTYITRWILERCNFTAVFCVSLLAVPIDPDHYKEMK
jgi:cell division protein FtsW (lipid II flippase)